MKDLQYIKNRITDLNPIRKKYIGNMRDKLINRDFSLLTSNCIGGIIYHDLGLAFKSPTINLMITSKEFIKFCLNLNSYFDQKMQFLDSDTPYPMANLGDIMISFTHYKSQKEALYKWEERKERIAYDNLFIITNDRDGVTMEDMIALQKISCKGIAVFSSKNLDIPCSFYLDYFSGESQVGNILKKNYVTGMRLFEKYFDYVKWFNNAAKDCVAEHYRKC